MSVALVNQTQGFTSTSGGTSFTATSFSVTTGNLIWVAVDVQNSGGTITVSDTAGNTYVQIGSTIHPNPGSGVNYIAQFYAKNITGNSSNVITIHSSTSLGSYNAVGAYQFSGLDPLSPLANSSTGTNTTGTALATGTISGGNVLVGFMEGDGEPLSGGTGFTLTAITGGSGYTAFEYNITSTSGTVSATQTTSDPWGIVGAAFKNAPLLPSTSDSVTLSENVGMKLIMKPQPNSPITVAEQIGITQEFTIYNTSQSPTSNYAFLESSEGRGIARDSQGNLYAVSNAYNPSLTFYTIRLYHSTNAGKTWSQTEIYNAYAAYAPKIAIDSQDVLHIVFEASKTPTNAINNIGYIYGTYGSLNAVQYLTNSATGNFTPTIAIDEYDTKHVVWSGYPASGHTSIYQIRYLNINSSQTVSGITELCNDAAGGNYSPDVAVDSKNNVVVSFYGEPGSFYVVRVIVFNYNSQSWGSVTQVSAGTSNCYVPSLAIDASDNYYVSYHNFAASETLEIDKYNGSSWSSFHTFSVATSLSYLYSSSMGFDKAGNMYIAFEDQVVYSTGNPTQIFYAKYNGSTWGTTMIIGGSTYFQVRPNILYAIWPKVNKQPGVPATGALGMWNDTEGSGTDQDAANLLHWQDLNLTFQTTLYTPTVQDPVSLSESVSMVTITSPDLVSLNAADSNAGGNGWVTGAKLIG